jgi:probable HAF family extracellular repeat protein
VPRLAPARGRFRPSARGWDGEYIRGLIWSEADGFTFLPPIPGGLVDRVYPRGLNASGRVVGFADLTLHSPRAFLWDAAHGTRNLNDLVQAPPNFMLDWAIKISDQGWIIGIGHYGPGWGTSRGFVLTPLVDAISVRTPVAARAVGLRLWPNPAVDRLSLRLELPARGRVRLSIFDSAGREVERLLDDEVASGVRLIPWNVGSTLPSGAYTARLQSSGSVRAERFIRIR